MRSPRLKPADDVQSTFVESMNMVGLDEISYHEAIGKEFLIWRFQALRRDQRLLNKTPSDLCAHRTRPQIKLEWPFPLRCFIKTASSCRRRKIQIKFLASDSSLSLTSSHRHIARPGLGQPVCCKQSFFCLYVVTFYHEYGAVWELSRRGSGYDFWFEHHTLNAAFFFKKKKKKKNASQKYTHHRTIMSNSPTCKGVLTRTWQQSSERPVFPFAIITPQSFVQFFFRKGRCPNRLKGGFVKG